MKYRGTKVTLSSVLTLIGVMSFATILVAAAITMTGVFTISQTVTVNPNITMNEDITGTALYTTENKHYDFTANVPRAMTAATISVSVQTSLASYSAGDVASDQIVVHFDGTDFTITLTGSGNTWSGSAAVHSTGQVSGVVVLANYNSGNYVSVTYNTAATYTLTVTMSGTAA